VADQDAKRGYHAPTLVEYGSIAKLTQAGTSLDGGGGGGGGGGGIMIMIMIGL
jgi:hypothetical protein